MARNKQELSFFPSPTPALSAPSRRKELLAETRNSTPTSILHNSKQATGNMEHTDGFPSPSIPTFGAAACPLHIAFGAGIPAPCSVLLQLSASGGTWPHLLLQSCSVAVDSITGPSRLYA
jgi:hypothetical protein